MTDSHSSSNLTTGTVHNRTVDDIDDISEGESNDRRGNEHSDSIDWPENQLGLPENQYYWGVRSSDFDEESNKQGKFLFNCKDGLNWWFNVADVKYANAGVQVDPVANSSGSKMTVDFVPKSEETVSETYLLTFLGLKWLWGQYIY